MSGNALLNMVSPTPSFSFNMVVADDIINLSLGYSYFAGSNVSFLPNIENISWFCTCTTFVSLPLWIRSFYALNISFKNFHCDYLRLQSIRSTKNIRTRTAAISPLPTAINVRISWGSPSDDTMGTEKEILFFSFLELRKIFPSV